MKKLITFLLRIDNFNRWIVLVSMVLFMVVPCWLLYCVDETKMDFDLIMPCVLLIGVVCGNGLLTIYRPLRCSFIYFVLIAITWISVFNHFDYDIIDLNINMNAIFWITIVYCAVGASYNLFYFLFYLRRRNKNISDETTNNDNIDEFLGGKKSNSDVVNMINNIIKEENSSNEQDKIKKNKLSKTGRVVSFVAIMITTICYGVDIVRSGISISSQLMIICVLLVLLLTFTFLASLLFPKDFKYMYYFNAFFLIITAIIACENASERPIMFILASLVLGASFLITLIVEGRTWTGSHPD